MVTYPGIFSWHICFLNANTHFAWCGSGNLQNNLTNTTAQVNEGVILRQLNGRDHLMHKLKARLSIHLEINWLQNNDLFLAYHKTHLRREWFIGIEFFRINDCPVVALLQDVLQ